MKYFLAIGELWSCLNKIGIIVLAVCLKLLTLQLYSTWNLVMILDRNSYSSLKKDSFLLRSWGLLVKNDWSISLFIKAYLVDTICTLLIVFFILYSKERSSIKLTLYFKRYYLLIFSRISSFILYYSLIDLLQRWSSSLLQAVIAFSYDYSFIASAINILVSSCLIFRSFETNEV